MSTVDNSSGNSALPTRRRRSFLAARRSDNSLEADTIPTPTETAEEEDDIPVLTEVVTAEPDKSPALTVGAPEPDLSASVDARIDELAAKMAEAIGRQMACELPTLIEATLLNASEDLRTGITATMEAALRDFNARRKQLQLPLDVPDEESNTAR